MIYVFKDGQLFKEIVLSYVRSTHFSMRYFNLDNPKDFPTDCYVYNTREAQWYVKRTRTRLRPLKQKHIPKELLMLCLLLNVPLSTRK